MNRRLCLSTAMITVLLILAACSPTGTGGNTSAPAVPILAENTPTLPEAQPAQSSAALTPTETQPVQATITSQESSSNSEDPRYILNILSPVLEGVPGADNFNQAVKASLDRQIEDFKKAAAENETWRKENIPDMHSELGANFEVKNNEHGITSILMNTYSYIAGAAHGVSTYSSFNFDVVNGEILILQDLFLPGSNYLERISDYCTRELTNQGLLSLPAGAAPKPENYQTWNILPDGILVTFQAYQVGAYAIGSPQILVPYAEIKNLIGEGSPLQPFIQ